MKKIVEILVIIYAFISFVYMTLTNHPIKATLLLIIIVFLCIYLLRPSRFKAPNLAR